MKKLLGLLVLLLVAYAGYRQFWGEPLLKQEDLEDKLDAVLSTTEDGWDKLRNRDKEEEEVPRSQEMDAVLRQIFGPLDRKVPDHEADIRKWARECNQEHASGKISDEAQRATLALCRKMMQASKDRAEYEAQLEELRKKEFASSSRIVSVEERNSQGATQRRMKLASEQQVAGERKAFFIDTQLRRWDEYANRERPYAQRVLTQVRAMEKK